MLVYYVNSNSGEIFYIEKENIDKLINIDEI